MTDEDDRHTVAFTISNLSYVGSSYTLYISRISGDCAFGITLGYSSVKSKLLVQSELVRLINSVNVKIIGGKLLEDGDKNAQDLFKDEPNLQEKLNEIYLSK